VALHVGHAHPERAADPPDELRLEPDYEIDFVGVLAQAQRRSELNTLATSLTMVGQLAQYSPEILDKINPDKVVDETWSITGAPVQVLRDDGEIKKIREARAEDTIKREQMMQAEQMAKTSKEAGQAASGFAKAQEMNKK